MKKISNDNNFENYLNTYVNVEVNGVVKKFFVSEINSGSIVTDAGILYNYTTLGESTIQSCPVCEDPCYNSVPIIELNFNGKGYIGSNNLLNNKLNETHDVYINNNKICRINTNTLSADFNRLWLIPFYSSNVQIPNFFDDYYTGFNATSVASCVFFDPSFYNNRNWNNLVIKPVSAYNPAYLNNPIPETFYTHFFAGLGAGFDRRESGVLSNKILVNSSNVSSVSCIAWKQYTFSSEANYIITCCYDTNCVYLSTDFKPYTQCQQTSTFFIDLDPCVNPTEYGLGFTYDGTRYYTNDAETTNIKYAYTPYGSTPDPYFSAPSLKKYIFYTNCLKSGSIVLYTGLDNMNGKIWYSDLGLTPFTGSYFYVDYSNPFLYPTGRVWEVEVVNGSEINSTPCT